MVFFVMGVTGVLDRIVIKKTFISQKSLTRLQGSASSLVHLRFFMLKIIVFACNLCMGAGGFCRYLYTTFF